MIHEEICTYEVAKLAKEKGFREMASCYQGYRKDGTLFYFSNMPDGKERVMQTDCLAPTQSLLQRWLREEKKIVVEVDYYSVEQKYYWRAYDASKCDVFASFIPPAKSMSRYDTWEQALESGLKYALKELK